MEVAGVILGAVPIVLEALKHYETLYRLCKRFKKCRNGVEELLNCLKTQKIIYQNETQLLLSDALGSDTAKTMIIDICHPLWHDPATMRRIDQWMGDSKDAVVHSVQQISTQMQHFEEELKALEIHESGTIEASGKQWRADVRRRFKYTFNESKLLKIASSITRATKTYRTLRSQIQAMAVMKPEPENNARASQAIERVVATQAAAKRIYELLSAACRLHTRHHSHLCLTPQYLSAGTTTEVRFQVAFRHLPRQHATESQDVLWFIVESVLTGTVATMPSTIMTRASHPTTKRSRSPPLVSITGSMRTQKKRVRIQSPPPNTQKTLSRRQSSSNATSCLPSMGPCLPNLISTADLCTQLRACGHGNQLHGACIGWLEQDRVYQSVGPQERAARKDAETLCELLKLANAGQTTNRGFSMLQCLQLARLLTSAVLNFNSTPWMQSCWKSRDIVLYDFDPRSTAMGKDPEAFVEVPIDEVNTTANQSTHDMLAPYVRNSVLFSLAVMLIELAFQRPFSDLIEPSDSTPGEPAALAEVNAADRLSKEISATLGPKYAKIVEQCLYCTFGQGTELGNPVLQSAIQRDVVAELDRLADGLQNMFIAR